MALICSGEQWVFGSVPEIKYSGLVGQSLQVSWPVRVQISTLTILAGGVKVWVGWSCKSKVMILFQIGEAPVMPEATWDMGELSLLPTQTAVKKLGV